MDDMELKDIDDEELLGRITSKPEDVELEKKNKGCLPDNPEYKPVMAGSMEDVESNPGRFIMPECLPACKELWSKNIYTFMVSDSMNEEAWIEVFAEGLSE